VSERRHLRPLGIILCVIPGIVIAAILLTILQVAFGIARDDSHSSLAIRGAIIGGGAVAGFFVMSSFVQRGRSRWLVRSNDS
jgi:Na+/citrate or Na+/malate symporter